MNLKEFGQLVLVYPEVHIWTGTVTVDPDEDLKAVKDQLPPASLVSSGSKRLIDPERLTPLKSARKRLERAIEDVSVPVLGSRGVPQCKLSELHAEIEQHVGEILSLKQSLIANLDVWYDEWEAKNPTWAHMLHRSRVPANVVDHRISARVSYGLITPVAGDPSSPLNAGLSAAASEVVPSLVDNIAATARETWARSFRGRGEVSQRAMRPVRALVEKMRSFAWCDNRIAPTVRAIESVLANVPRTGPLSMVETTIVSALLNTLMDPKRVLQHGEAVMAGDAEDVVEEEPDAAQVELPLVA